MIVMSLCAIARAVGEDRISLRAGDGSVEAEIWIDEILCGYFALRFKANLCDTFTVSFNDGAIDQIELPVTVYEVAS